jgi:hypothetical protein
VSRSDYVPRPVDLDLLADYAAGVLEPPAAAEVTHLISSDPAWTRAHADLVHADAAVSAELRAYAQAPVEPMPADVAARIDDALRAAGSTNVVPITAAAGGRGARSRPRHASAASAGRRRFATRLATAAAAAAAVIGGVAVVQNLGGDVARDSPAGGMGSHAESDQGAGVGGDPAAPEAPPTLYEGGPVVFATGANYEFGSLSQFPSTVPRPAAAPSLGEGLASGDDKVVVPGDRVGPPRLNDKVSLRECLAAIAAEHPGRVLAVDYARFEGQAALIVLVEAPTAFASGRFGVPGTVVAVGPDCGVSGADVRAAVPTS